MAERQPGQDFQGEARMESKALKIVGYIENFVLANNESVDVKDQEQIEQSFAEIPAVEKALMLHRYLSSFLLEYASIRKETREDRMERRNKKREEWEAETEERAQLSHEERAERWEQKSLQEPLQNIADPYFIGEIKALWDDSETRRIFLNTYGEALGETKVFRVSQLGKEFTKKRDLVGNLEEAYETLKQSLVLRKIKSPTKRIAAESRLKRIVKDLLRARSDKEKIVRLEGDLEHTPENTDVAATIMFDTLMQYHKEAKENGFAKLPSRQKLHKQILDVMEGSGRIPFLIGPPGTGKTTQLQAVAQELTGQPAIIIPCSKTLSAEEGLIERRDIREGKGGFDFSGCIGQAYTGYEHSSDSEPSAETGRMVVLDEIPKLDSDKSIAGIKTVALAEVGKPLSRDVPFEVLPGSSLGATGNDELTDEALEREFARVPVDYFEMNKENPELYEFMLAKLLDDDKSFPVIAESELAPKYTDVDVADGETLSDGSRVVGRKELVADVTSVEHGFLYRLAYAVRTLQDAYIHGSKFNEKHLANTALYWNSDDKGNIRIEGFVPDMKAGKAVPAGEMIKLTSGKSTLTAKIISKWMDGFNSRNETDNEKAQVKTLTEWIQLQLENHMKQTSKNDAAMIRALLDHWHIFDEAKPVGKIKPLTPKEVGYLSPRVPRPLKLERPQPIVSDETETSSEEVRELGAVETYEDTEVVLESGERVLIKKMNFAGETLLSDEFAVATGKKFRVDGRDFRFAGVATEEGDNKGKLDGSLVEEADLHELFSADDIELGIMDYALGRLERNKNRICAREKAAVK